MPQQMDSTTGSRLSMGSLHAVGGRAGAGGSGVSHAGTRALRPNQGASRRLGPTLSRAQRTKQKTTTARLQTKGYNTAPFSSIRVKSFHGPLCEVLVQPK